jgi:hypothetical protein
MNKKNLILESILFNNIELRTNNFFLTYIYTLL